MRPAGRLHRRILGDGWRCYGAKLSPHNKLCSPGTDYAIPNRSNPVRTVCCGSQWRRNLVAVLARSASPGLGGNLGGTWQAQPERQTPRCWGLSAWCGNATCVDVRLALQEQHASYQLALLRRALCRVAKRFRVFAHAARPNITMCSSRPPRKLLVSSTHRRAAAA